MMGQPQATLVDRGIIPVEESITAIAADQGKLYVATAGKEIRIYDISDPSLILEVESLPVTLPVRSLAINGSHLYVAAGTDGLHVLDLSIPGKTEPVATYPVPSESLYPAGRLVYLAMGSDGLHLLKAGPIATATFNAQVAPGGSFSFSPDPININTSDTVNWTWGGSNHSTTSGISPNADGKWDSGVHSPPFQFPFTFNTPGSFPYFCSVHHFTGTVNVTSAGPVINISVTPTSVDFGNVNVGSNSDQMITITNLMTSNATLSGNVGAPAAPFSVQSGGGPFSLTPGQSVIVTVRFSPTAEGAAASNLSIIHNATNQTNPTSIPLIGTGLTPGIHISVNPASLNFGNVTVGQSTSQNITILNQANSTGPLTGSVSALTGPFSIVSGGGPFNLPPGQSQIVTVSFSPAVAGASFDTLIITHNATEQASPTNIPLSGTGVTTPMPDLIVSSISGPHLNKPGGRIAISNTITNQGTLAAGSFVVNFYLSTDQQITTNDTFLGKRSVRGLAVGASSGPMSTNVTIPKSVTTGSYFIGAIVDPTNVILESNEGNNTASDPAGINVCLSLAKPKLLSPKSRGTNISTTPTLTWSSVTGASTYEVQVATDKGFTNIVASTTGLTTPQWAVTPALSSGTTYSWRARAVNLCGPGPFSPTSSFKTAP
jgi:plastocyanin